MRVRLARAAHLEGAAAVGSHGDSRYNLLQSARRARGLRLPSGCPGWEGAATGSSAAPRSAETPGVQVARLLRPAAHCGSLLLVLALALPALARVVRLYEVRHRVAAELVPLVEPMLGDDARIVADTRSNALVLSGEPAAVESALALIAALDKRLRTVVLRYASEDAAALAARGARIDWRIDAGSLRLGTLHGPPASGSALHVRADETARERERGDRALLRILEGESGRIASGVVVPFVSRELRRGPHGSVLHETTQLVSAESGFEATPRVLGDGRIELALRPFHDRLGSDGRIETAGAQTRIVVSPGETVVIGSLAEQQRDRGRSLSGAAASEGSGERVLLLSASLD